ncbi:ATP-binding cassette sub-family A member 3, partial [Stegodyphus mimosarum]
MTIMLCVPFTKNGAIFNSSNPFCIFVWLMVYASSLIAFCFFITALFSQTSSAVGGTCVLFFLTFMPYMQMLHSYRLLLLSAKVLFSILPNTLLAYSVQIILYSEASGSGLQWNRMKTTAPSSIGLEMGTILWIFIANTVFYFTLMWYVEGIFPEKHEVPQP